MSTAAAKLPNVGELARLRGLAVDGGRRVAPLLWRGLKATARGVRVMILVFHLGLVWSRFWVRVGVARWEVKRQHFRVSDRELRQGRAGSPERRLIGVPRITGWKATTRGATVRVSSKIAQNLDTFRPHMGLLASTLRIRKATVRQVPNKPGRYELSLLWRDPLDRVEVTPRVEGQRVVFARNEHGTETGVDFARNPHLLVPGSTGSGKSSYVNGLLYALSGTEDLLALVDLKFGLEAQLFAPRASVVCEDPEQAAETVSFLLERAAARAEICKTFGCRDVGELEAEHGIRLRRVFLVVDEVAELALASLPAEEAEAAKKRIDATMGEVLRFVQLVRAVGFHLILSGQRFGSDIGPKVTSIRAQVGGRSVGRCHDPETVQMSLPGLDKELHAQVMSFDRPGLMAHRVGSDIEVQRPRFWSTAELADRARATADQAIPLTALAAEDERRAFGIRQTPEVIEP